MRAEVAKFYRLARSPRAVGHYETAHHRQPLRDIEQAVYDGDLVAPCGVVGAGETVTLRCLQEMPARESRVIVSKSVAVEKGRATPGTLIAASSCDLPPDKEPGIPEQGEPRERGPRHLFRERRKPIVPVVDEARDLHHHALTGLERLIETAAVSSPRCRPATPGCATTRAARPRRRSATGPRCSRWKASPAASASTSSG